jgi:hypothetical protein
VSRTRRVLPTAAVAAMVVAGVSGLRGADAGERGVPAPIADLLQRADSDRGDFAGVVEVEWRDTDGDAHRARVRVQRQDGTVVVDGHRDVRAHGDDRYVESPGGWSSIGGVPDPTELVDPAAEWRLEATGDQREIAGHTTFEVEAVDVETGLVRERLYLARRAPFLFQRETLDVDGEIVRSVALVRWQPGSDGLGAPPTGVVEEEPEVAVAPPGDVPETAGDGFRLVAAYDLADGVSQLVYRDGLFEVSVFVDEGELDPGALPPGAATRAVGGEEARAYSTAIGDVLVWQDDDDRVLAWVSDAPPDLLAAVAASFIGDDDRGPLGRAADVLLGPFAWR